MYFVLRICIGTHLNVSNLAVIVTDIAAIVSMQTCKGLALAKQSFNTYKHF